LPPLWLQNDSTTRYALRVHSEFPQRADHSGKKLWKRVARISDFLELNYLAKELTISSD
jgi:hypothetical protein